MANAKPESTATDWDFEMDTSAAPDGKADATRPAFEFPFSHLELSTPSRVPYEATRRLVTSRSSSVSWRRAGTSVKGFSYNMENSFWNTPQGAEYDESKKTAPGRYDPSSCVVCQCNSRPLTACGQCGKAFYCTKTCQEEDAAIHGAICDAASGAPTAESFEMCGAWKGGAKVNVGNLQRALKTSAVLTDFYLRMGLEKFYWGACMYFECEYKADVVRVLRRHKVPVGLRWSDAAEGLEFYTQSIRFHAEQDSLYTARSIPTGIKRDSKGASVWMWRAIHFSGDGSASRHQKYGTYGQVRILCGLGVEPQVATELARGVDQVFEATAYDNSIPGQPPNYQLAREMYPFIRDMSDASAFSTAVHMGVHSGVADKKTVDERQLGLPSLLFSLNILEQHAPLLSLVLSYDRFLATDLPFWNE